jgi:hypothetical protein
MLRMPELSSTSPFSVAEMVGVAIRNVQGHIAGLDGSELDGSAGLNERLSGMRHLRSVGPLTEPDDWRRPNRHRASHSKIAVLRYQHRLALHGVIPNHFAARVEQPQSVKCSDGCPRSVTLSYATGTILGTAAKKPERGKAAD